MSVTSQPVAGVVSRIALGLQYNGADYAGWQVQPHGRTVQDVFQHALAQFTGTNLSVTCAGRTDAGVHALSQVVHFDTDLARPLTAWVRGVNRFLPANIAVQWARQVEADFHARFSAQQRSYLYLLHQTPVRSPILQRQVGWTHHRLDLAAMQAAAHYLVGEHDFSSFRSSECQAKTPIKTLYEIKLIQFADLIVFHISANAFLHHMVRNIVGSLVQVGQGKQASDWLFHVLQARDRRLAAPTFMPDGLYLSEVVYPKIFALPEPSIKPWQDTTVMNDWLLRHFFEASPVV